MRSAALFVSLLALCSIARAEDPLLDPASCAVEDGTTTACGSQVSTAAPEMRCVFTRSNDQVYLFFIYSGDTATLAHLGDGSVRRQIGLKVIAQNTCNVLYVMWWTDGTIQASMKINPNMSTHAQCADGGYSVIGSYSGPPLVVSTSVHMLHVRILRATKQLVIQTDNGSAHTFVLPDPALQLIGPTGLRTDNCIADMTTLVTP